MQFQKVKDDVFNCFILNEELRKMNINPQNIAAEQIYGNLMNVILENAIEKGIIDESFTSFPMEIEAQFNPLGLVVSCTIMKPENIPEELREVLDAITNHLTETDIEELMERSNTEPVCENSEIPVLETADNNDSSQKVKIILELDSLNEAIEICKQICITNVSCDDLYKLDGKYFMILDTTDAKSLIFNVSEYTSSIYTNPMKAAYIREHGSLISAGCISALSQL